MNLTSPRISFGLSATVTPSSVNVSGDNTIGVSSNLALASADKIYSASVALYASTNYLTLNAATNAITAQTTLVPGTAQVETATAAGTVSAGGNASVVFTSAAVTGSPITLSVAVATSDTPTLWAAKVRTALAANTAIAAKFDISGTTTAIIATRKGTYTTDTTLAPAYAADDTTLNIALATGTATGITTAATSANTTTGVASTGAVSRDADAKDFEGASIGTLATLYGLFIQCTDGAMTLTSTTDSNSVKMVAGGVFLLANSSGNVNSFLDSLTFTATAANTAFKIVALGNS